MECEGYISFFSQLCPFLKGMSLKFVCILLCCSTSQESGELSFQDMYFPFPFQYSSTEHSNIHHFIFYAYIQIFIFIPGAWALQQLCHHIQHRQRRSQHSRQREYWDMLVLQVKTIFRPTQQRLLESAFQIDGQWLSHYSKGGGGWYYPQA